MKKFSIVIVVILILLIGGWLVYKQIQDNFYDAVMIGGDNLIPSELDPVLPVRVENEDTIRDWNIIESKNYSVLKGALSFAIKFPKDWEVSEGGIECGQVFNFAPPITPDASIKLIVFSSCWEDSIGGNRLSFDKTFNRFCDSFLLNKDSSSSLGLNPLFKDVYGMRLTIVQYNNSDNIINGIYALTYPKGTIALWEKDVTGYALLDENNRYQDNKIYNNMLATFRFNSDEVQYK